MPRTTKQIKEVAKDHVIASAFQWYRETQRENATHGLTEDTLSEAEITLFRAVAAYITARQRDAKTRRKENKS